MNLVFLNNDTSPLYPKYILEPARKPFVEKSLKDNLIDHCFSIEGNCALHLRDNIPYRAINFGKNKNAYKSTLNDRKVFEDPFKRVDL